jgi:hypothetical protein
MVLIQRIIDLLSEDTVAHLPPYDKIRTKWSQKDIHVAAMRFDKK